MILLYVNINFTVQNIGNYKNVLNVKSLALFRKSCPKKAAWEEGIFPCITFRLVSASGLNFCFLKEMFLSENRDSMPLASQAVQG